MRAGDTLVVASLDRLGRTLQDLISIVADLRRRGIGFRSLHEALDTTTPGGRLVFHVFAAPAEFIPELIIEVFGILQTVKGPFLGLNNEDAHGGVGVERDRQRDHRGSGDHCGGFDDASHIVLSIGEYGHGARISGAPTLLMHTSYKQCSMAMCCTPSAPTSRLQLIKTADSGHLSAASSRARTGPQPLRCDIEQRQLARDGRTLLGTFTDRAGRPDSLRDRAR